MKNFLTTIAIATSMAFATVACANETKEAPAKPAEVKKVCLDKLTKDGKVVLGKDGKPVQDCKEVKIHKKLEGTQVPAKK